MGEFALDRLAKVGRTGIRGPLLISRRGLARFVLSAAVVDSLRLFNVGLLFVLLFISVCVKDHLKKTRLLILTHFSIHYPLSYAYFHAMEDSTYHKGGIKTQKSFHLLKTRIK